MSSGTQPSRALLIAAGSLTQLIGVACLILAFASLPVVHDLNTGTGGVIASIVASLAAILCGTLVWRGRLVPLALAAGLDVVGFGIGLPREGSAMGSMLRMLPADELGTAETLVMIGAVVMFLAAILCVVAVPSALKLRQWARDAQPSPSPPVEARRAVRTSGQTLRGLGPEGDRSIAGPNEVRIGDSLARGFPRGAREARADAGPPHRWPTARRARRHHRRCGDADRDRHHRDHGDRRHEGRGFDGRRRPGRAAARRSRGSKTRGPSHSTIQRRRYTVPRRAMAAYPRPMPPRWLRRWTTSSREFTTCSPSRPPPSSRSSSIANAFAFGADAHDVAEGRDAVLAQLREDLGNGGTVLVKFAQVGHDGDVGWFAEELKIGGKTFVVSAVAGLRDNAWTIAALHLAVAMPNATAYQLARDGELSIPDAIPDAHDESPLASAMRTAFASKPSFVEARSARPEAFNFGSAPGERLKGGEAIRKIFAAHQREHPPPRRGQGRRRSVSAAAGEPPTSTSPMPTRTAPRSRKRFASSRHGSRKTPVGGSS